MDKVIAFFGLIFLTGATLMGIVALATSFWSEKGDDSIGFFQTCHRNAISDEIFCTNNLDDDHRDNFKDDEWFLGSLGAHLGGVLFGFVALIFWVPVMCSHRTGIRAVSIICAIISFAGYLIAVIIWKFKYKEDTVAITDWDEGFSYWLAVGATAASGVAVILMIVSAITHGRSRK